MVFEYFDSRIQRSRFFSVLNISIFYFSLVIWLLLMHFFPDTSTHVLSTAYSSSYSLCKKNCWRLYHFPKNGELGKLEWDIKAFATVGNKADFHGYGEKINKLSTEAAIEGYLVRVTGEHKKRHVNLINAAILTLNKLNSDNFL